MNAVLLFNYDKEQVVCEADFRDIYRGYEGCRKQHDSASARGTSTAGQKDPSN